MDPADSFRADGLSGLVDAAGDLLGRFDMIDFDVDDAESELDVSRNFLERLEIAIGTMGEFQDEVIRVESVKEIDQRFPAAGLNRLSAVVAKAKVDRPLAIHLVENAIDGGLSERSVLWAARYVGFIDLNASGGKFAYLFRESIRNGEGEFFERVVVVVEKSPSEHVWARKGKLERTVGDGCGSRAGLEEIERTLADRAANDAGRLATERHFLFLLKGLRVGDAYLCIDSAKTGNKVLDHSVGVGMIYVEAVELAVGRKIDSILLLGMNDDRSSVEDRLFAGQGSEPVDGTVGSNRGR